MNQCLGWQPSLCLCFRHCSARCYGVVNDLPTYKTYSQEHLNRDLAAYLEPSAGLADFNGKYPSDFIAKERPIICQLGILWVGSIYSIPNSLAMSLMMAILLF